MENLKSQRGKIVEGVVNLFLENYTFEKVDTIKQELQEVLNTNLSFKTDVSRIENRNNNIVGEIAFENEDDKPSVLNFNIAPTGALQ